jgi:hypothetical protein
MMVLEGVPNTALLDRMGSWGMPVDWVLHVTAVRGQEPKTIVADGGHADKIMIVRFHGNMPPVMEP